MKSFAPLLLLLVLVAGACRRSEPAAAGGPPAGRPPAQVIAVPAARQAVSETLPLIGSLAANEQVEIKSETDGTVELINFSEGEPVEAGRLLVQLDDSKLPASLAEAEANLALSRGNHERAKQLLGDKLISQQEFDQTSASFAANDAAVQLRRRQLQDTRIHAPFAGIVSSRLVSPGQVITRNSTLTWLVDLDPMKIEMQVPEKFLSKVLSGQDLELSVNAWPDQRFTGKVYFVSPYVDPDTRSLLVKATVPNPDAHLKPGMFAGLELTLQVRTNAIVIPESAVNRVLDGDRAAIMIVGAESKVEVREVKVGLRVEGQIEVINGLTDGELVIVEGLQKISPGMTVKLAPPEAAKPYLPAGKPAAGNRS